MNNPPHSTKMTRAQIICLPFTSFVGLDGQEPTFMAEQRNNWTLVRTVKTLASTRNSRNVATLRFSSRCFLRQAVASVTLWRRKRIIVIAYPRFYLFRARRQVVMTGAFRIFRSTPSSGVVSPPLHALVLKPRDKFTVTSRPVLSKITHQDAFSYSSRFSACTHPPIWRYITCVVERAS